jgi:predicted ATPase
MLLVLDNLEQVVAVAPQLGAVLEACPNLRLLVTSRELLRIRGEVEYEVLPLADHEAVELFSARAQLEPTPAVEELCRRLDNMPLALELAAARTKSLTPEQILDRLGQRLDLFKGGRDVEDRQQTLRATIEWSHDLLTPEERTLFARLGVFAGGCTVESAEAVAAADLDTLQSLVEKSLLRHTSDRFWMLETIREYAVERLATEEGKSIHRRHAKFFRDFADAAGVCVEAIQEGRPSRMDVALAEQANLRAALDWAAEHDPALGLEIAAALEQFWVTQDPFEGQHRFEDMLARAHDAPPLLRARALRALSGSSSFTGDHERALAAGQEALVLYREAGDENGELTMLFRLGTLFLTAHVDRARPLLEEALAGFRRIGNKMGECEAGGNLAELELMTGDAQLARRLLEENIELAREIGFTWWEAGKAHSLAEHLLMTGDLDEAWPWAVRALELSRQGHDRSGSVYTLACFAWAAAARGDASGAGRVWGAIEAEERRGGPVGRGWEATARAQYEGELAAVAGQEFEHGRAEGTRLSLDEAIESALAEETRPPRCLVE